MKILYFTILILCTIILVCTTSCNDDVNDWAIDSSYDAPFRSTGFEAKTNSATSVFLTYKGVIDASKYVFEFSEGDSLVFNNIVRTVEILADTLTVYSDNVAPTKREYRTLFENLKGTTRYSARMKGIDKNNKETGYVQLYFDTPTEQVRTWYKFGPNSVTIYWDVTRPINKLLYGVYAEGKDTDYETYLLDEPEKGRGEITLTGLTSGTTYDILLMLDDQRRGFLKGTTTGDKYSVQTTIDNTTDVNALLTEQIGLGNKNITLIFPVLSNDAVYEIGQINIPDGIEKLYFEGFSTTPELPKLFLHAVRLNGLVQSVNFNNINIDGRKNSSNYFFNIDNADKYFKNVYFKGCEINNISRSLVRLSAAISVDNVVVDNCIVFNVSSSYGFYNSGSASVSLKLLSITQTTMREIGDQLADIQGTHNMFLMNNVTFCNYTTTNLSKLIRWRNAPGGLQITNNIFTGTNADKTLDAIYNNTFQMDFTSCYKTNEWTWSSYPFTNITEVDMTGEEMFVDPRNGDFHIKNGVRFAGANKAGDPRWWDN